jgi:hypothetical protein
MRYAVCYRPGSSVMCFAYVHVDETSGTFRLARPVMKDKEFSVEVESAVRRLDPTPAQHDSGPGPEGLTYHA